MARLQNEAELAISVQDHPRVQVEQGTQGSQSTCSLQTELIEEGRLGNPIASLLDLQHCVPDCPWLCDLQCGFASFFNDAQDLIP